MRLSKEVLSFCLKTPINTGNNILPGQCVVGALAHPPISCFLMGYRKELNDGGRKLNRL